MNNTTLETHPTVNACLWCGKDKGTRAKYCSRACGQKYGHQARKSTAPRCNEPGCNKPVQARGMCGSHYGQWHRTEGGKERTYTCTECGNEYISRRKSRSDRRFCTTACQLAHIVSDEQAAAKREQTKIGMGLVHPIESRECAHCKGEFMGRANGSKYCSNECSGEYMRKLALDRRSPLRKAYEANDHKGMLKAIKKRVSITKNGCWEWNRLDSDGYARVTIGDKNIALHRLVLEAKHEAPLGSQAAHHICANTKCVNPEHLQPVTHRDNVAEMLARHSYLNRIAELEEVIKEIAPNHEVLNRVPIQ